MMLLPWGLSLVGDEGSSSEGEGWIGAVRCLDALLPRGCSRSE
jgi:hypothetical protein